MEMLKLYVNDGFKFFFILTPFFVLSMFSSMTVGWHLKRKKILAIRVSLAIASICLIIYFFGNYVFQTFGITINAFRIGGGSLLFLSAVSLVNGSAFDTKIENAKKEDIAVVPLAIPVTVGPGTTAALIILGATDAPVSQRIISIASLLTAIFALFIMLFYAGYLERVLRRRGMTILSKVTGLVLAALSAQIVFDGIKNFLFK